MLLQRTFHGMIFCIAIILSGCAQLDIKEPNVTLLNFGTAPSSTLLGKSFVLDLKVSNPNGIPMPLSGMSYAFGLNNAKLLTGVTNDVSTIAAYGSQNISLALDINLLEIPKLLGMLNNAQNASYFFDATLNLKGLIPDLKVSQTGNLNELIKN